MTNEEAIKILSDKSKKMFNAQECIEHLTRKKQALEMGIKALEREKVGHWIDTDEWRETVDGFEQWGYFRKCSKCGYVFKFLEIDNYCPNCGAKMESEDKE